MHLTMRLCHATPGQTLRHSAQPQIQLYNCLFSHISETFMSIHCTTQAWHVKNS